MTGASEAASRVGGQQVARPDRAKLRPPCGSQGSPGP